MTHDMALAIGLIWAMGTIACFYIDYGKPHDIMLDLFAAFCINFAASVLFYLAYMVSYLIACGIR